MNEVKIKGIFLAAIVLAGILLTTARMSVGMAASQTDINNAIDKGLAYLNSTQALDGSWGSSFAPAACTAMAVLSFENAPNNHFGWNTSDPYYTTVQKGLDWLFAHAHVQSLSNKTLLNGTVVNPDSNGNGIGIYFGGQPVYETPMALMAIVSSTAPTNVTTTGVANVIGRTYKDIVVDIVDYLSWAQNLGPTGEGGWRYFPQYSDSDNSVSQWPVLGLIIAHRAWNITAPSWVGTELLKWIAADQYLSGNYSTNPVYGAFDYQPGRGLDTPTDTATGILELTYCNITDTDPRIIAAEGYLNRDWNPNGYCPNGDDYPWNRNVGSLYNMYAVMKAMRETILLPTQFIANYNGTQGVEWYNGTGEYADALVAHQHPDGSWADWVYWAEYLDPSLSTAFGVLILEYQPTPNRGNLKVTVVDSITNAPITAANVSIQGPDNGWNITGPDGSVTFFNIRVGPYNATASMDGYFPNSTYPSVMDGLTTYCTISLEPTIRHDVAVIAQVPDADWVYQGKLCHAGVNVTVANLGGAAENFTVTLFAVNDTATPSNITVGSQAVLNLLPNATLVLRFVWNSIEAQPCHWYNMIAVASMVPDETNTTNNECLSPALVKVRLVGDVNGDGKVNLQDVTIAALTFGQTPGGPRWLPWGPQIDVNNDNKINLQDYYLVAINFGKSCT